MQNHVETGANLQASLRERERLATLYGDVGLALTRSGSLPEVLGHCAEAVQRNLDAAFARIWSLNPRTNVLELEASAGVYTHLDGPHSRVPVGQFKIGLIAAERKPHLTNSVLEDPRVSDQQWARREGMVAFAGYPLIVEDRLMGVLAMFARQPLSPVLLQALETVAHGAALLIKQKKDEEALRASEKRKTAILETALDCIITTDHAGIVLEFNPAAESTFGFAREQVVGRNLLELIVPPELREDHTRGIASYLSGSPGQPFGQRFETTAMRAGGARFPVEFAIVRISMDGADLFTMFLRDITERREAEVQRERLLASTEAAERSYREVAEAMPQQVWTARPNGALDYINRRGLDYFGRSAAELLGSRWLGVVEPSDAPRVKERWRQSLETGELYEVEFRLANAAGEYRWHLGRGVAVRDGKGAIVRWVGTNTDIQNRKKSEEDLRDAKASADLANQAKSVFLASMSHELRTPLNAVIGYSEMLQEEVAERNLADLAPDLQKIHRAGGYLLNLINNVLDLSKIEAGKMELFLEDFEVADMLEDVATTVEPLIARNGNHLEVICAPEAGWINSDRTKVRQCLLNLLSNAAKFTDHGSIRLEASRSRADVGDSITLTVRDTGLGLSPAQVGKLFEPFAQFHSGRETRQEGTGLGLAITRRICELLGGRITLESEPGKGSLFSITLPVNAPVSKPEPEPGSPEHAAGASSREDVVLTIDDDPGSRDLIGRFLRKEGFRPVPAENGEEALRLARQLRPRVITLDVMMPGLDGWAVLSALKSDPDVADIPVIMVSVVENKNLAFALGAIDHLTKPIDRKRLSQILERYCRPELNGPVLLVEDDEASRALVSKTVADAGWQLMQAENGAAALRLMEEQTPVLILLDLLMPTMDGFEFARTVRSDERWRAIPIIVSTSKDLSPADRERLAGNVEAVLAKGTYSREDLLREIRELALRSRGRT